MHPLEQPTGLPWLGCKKNMGGSVRGYWVLNPTKSKYHMCDNSLNTRLERDIQLKHIYCEHRHAARSLRIANTMVDGCWFAHLSHSKCC